MKLHSGAAVGLEFSSGKLTPMPAGLAQWRFQTHAQPISGQDWLFAEARCFFLLQLANRASCLLATDSILSLCSRGGATRPQKPISPSRARTGFSAQPLASQGNRLRTWRLGRPGTARGWPRLPVRSCRRPGSLPETLKWSGLSSAPANHIIQLLPVLLAGRELGEPAGALTFHPPGEERARAGRGGAQGSTSRAARRGQSARLGQMRAAPGREPRSSSSAPAARP